MLYIAHRGNIDGINSSRENSPSYIQEALDAGYDVEIDLWTPNGIPHLGHDYPQYKVTEKWLAERKKHLWIHAKTFAAASWLATSNHEFEYFCHQSDSCTLTASNFIWLHDLAQIPNHNCVIPLLSKDQVKKYKYKNIGAVCSDFILDCKQKFQ